MRVFIFSILALLTIVNAVKFELFATPVTGTKRCVSQFIGRDVLVSGTFNIGDGELQISDVEISDDSPERNKFFYKKDVSGTIKFAFTTHAFADVNFCVLNTLVDGVPPSPNTKRLVNIHIDSGADAVDYSEIAKQEKLKPMEIELRKLESEMDRIVSEMEFLKEREAAMRDTNESTNERVKYFSLLSITTLISVGVWQIWHLRQFFAAKKLI
ncbi:hypothetical protein SmJEL517_g04042 [Synchytrium microbalum]|uniref:GOLD domain-containing protein n=1 Tax=Synchytrium microbalum TaxID=1806994 RepID=A0A507BTN9_9FUNG|nr:uncharacterized protein SmJEL517_g04042 [Synchytrium microbalum]TPX32900.1 hypothetical protein SmJEL517_g04042 [Synchytrium microbalum]